MKWGIVLLALCTTTVLTASGGPQGSVESRAKDAKLVVIGTVSDVQSAFAVNQFGDQVIVSNVTMRVDESMKGVAPGRLSMSIEGGTVGDITLRVSDMPLMARGERAVLFLDETMGGAHVPHDRGLGILKLTSGNQVQGSDLTLTDVRAIVQRANAK